MKGSEARTRNRVVKGGRTGTGLLVSRQYSPITSPTASASRVLAIPRKILFSFTSGCRNADRMSGYLGGRKNGLTEAVLRN